MTRSATRFAGRFVRATFAGWALGFVLVLVFIGITGAIGAGDTQFAVGLGMGAGVGLLQARVLREHIGRRGPWTTASAVGLALPFLVSDLTRFLPADMPYSLPVLVVAGGVIAGVLQWRILRKASATAVWWIAASAAGWSLAGATVVFNDRFLPRIPGITGALLFIAVVLISGVLLGVVGGGALARILGIPPEGSAA